MEVITFICVFILFSDGATISREDNVIIEDRSEFSQLLVRVPRNRARILAASSSSFQGWSVWETNQGQMYGVKRNNKWYFMGVSNGILMLKEGVPPTGRILPNDQRLFDLVWIVHNRQVALKHLPSNRYVKRMGKKVLLTDDIAAAVDVNVWSKWLCASATNNWRHKGSTDNKDRDMKTLCHGLEEQVKNSPVVKCPVASGKI